MLTLTRHLTPTQHHLDTLPTHILLHFTPNKIFQRVRQSLHKLCAGCDLITIKRHQITHHLSPLPRLCQAGRRLCCRAEAALSLLVHLCPGGDAVQRHVEEATGADEAE